MRAALEDAAPPWRPLPAVGRQGRAHQLRGGHRQPACARAHRPDEHPVGGAQAHARPTKGAKAQATPRAAFSLFEAPFENLPLRDAVDFYRHDKGWANRLVAGDSLLVMNSLLQKEGMAGQVQMIYIDPPYGIKYGSNFQPFVNKRDVKDRSDADLTQEPEMIKAFRDTWELGHSLVPDLSARPAACWRGSC
jgi:adenine-specific DNA-methyltransferase